MSQMPVYGFSERWESVCNHHKLFFEKTKNLEDFWNKAYERNVSLSCQADKAVHYLGALCIDDFREILLLCGNGLGIGGMKILRGLFERAVTASYISEAPDTAQEFLDYYYVHRKKQFSHFKDYIGDKISDFINPAELELVNEQYENVKDKFTEILCKKCGTTKIMFSWSKMDLISMAKKVGLGNQVWDLYYIPMLQTHPTASSIVDRVGLKNSDTFTFKHEAQMDAVGSTLFGAHKIILRVLENQNNHFSLGMDDEFQKLRDDFKTIWQKKKNAYSS
ncbi:MAG: hypothetical protein GY868_21550 [Deltaproteobacteria bacterium]|nr:hypothetical protein [Deltaproteobacteria bacterium]